MKYVGVDVHKKFCRVCLKNRDGIILDEFNIPNSRGGFALPLDAISGRRRPSQESTGNPTGPPLHRPRRRCPGVVLANPKKTRAIAEARLKNPRDARTLADLLRADPGGPQPAFHPKR